VLSRDLEFDEEVTYYSSHDSPSMVEEIEEVSIPKINS
jgi:hypothetical protein